MSGKTDYPQQAMSCSAQQMFIAAFTDTHLLPAAQIPVPGPLSPRDLWSFCTRLKHSLVMQIPECDTCESICWENKTPLHSQGNIYCSPFTIHLPANIPMRTRERMITSKVFASSEVPMRIAAAMEKRLFISKVPFLQRSSRREDSAGHC